MTYIQQSACRLMRALFEVALKREWGSLAEKLLTLCKMVERRTWCSQSPLRQFGGIPEAIIRKLEKNSDITWDRYYDLKPQDLGEMVKMPKMGKTLHKYVHMFPKLEVSALVQPISRSMLKVDLTITPDFQFDVQVTSCYTALSFSLWLICLSCCAVDVGSRVRAAVLGSGSGRQRRENPPPRGLHPERQLRL
jgi:pre-mRNA-splicing helicase BRR2